MCVLCFNSQWRSVVIGTVSSVLSLLLLLLTIGAKDVIQDHCKRKLLEQNCIHKSIERIDEEKEAEKPKITYSLSSSKDESECVYLVFEALFPWPLWTVLGLYFLLNANLVIAAVYK